ncbi:MAG: glycoside hydrolase family 38 C-terminal domain-containing protein [bacterium]
MSHTHWDREWYHTAGEFRQRLVSVIDDLLDDPPRGDESFLLDGQAVLLDDYLAIRPERVGELATMLRDHRLEAGPWYVLADELIPDGEALVRNLLAGRRALRSLRADSPNVLYCPDSFGHPAALPDIAIGFGCDVVILWRGYGGARWPSGDTVRWRGRSGEKVLVYHLPPDGYEFGSSLPVSLAASHERWQRIASTLSPRAVTGAALLLNGADHHQRQRHLRTAVELLADQAQPTRVVTMSLRSAARAIVMAASGCDLPEIEGELRDSYGYTWTLQGTLATRAAQKRRSARAGRALVRDVEPWLALGDGGSPAARALLDATWRALLLAHPHDTLCGTSVDAVAAAFDTRLSSAEEQATGLRTRAVHELIDHDAEAARVRAGDWLPVVALRNPAPRPRGGVAEVTLRVKVADIAVGPGSASRQGPRRRPQPFRVAGMPLQVLSRKERVQLTESPRAYPDADVIMEARAVGWVPPIAGYGVQSFAQRGHSQAGVPNPVVATPRSLDNGRVRLDVDDAGQVSLSDASLGRRVVDLITLERRRDVGDLYTPALREFLEPPRVRRVRVTHRGPLRGEIVIDYAFSARSGSRSVASVALRLDADCPVLYVRLSGENHHRDQRLRLIVQTGLGPARTVADAAFGAVERSPLAITDSDAAMEHVVASAPLHRWVARFAKDCGATVYSDGLAEYESGEDGSIAITLLRSVGELSRSDLPERPGHAGWPAPTPDAQCIGEYEALIAVWLHGPDCPAVRDEIERYADDVLLPITGETLRSNLLPPLSAAGLELVGSGLIFSAACPAQREGWIVLRCRNQADTIANGEWRVGRPIEEATRARLDETPTESLSVAHGVIRFVAAPGEIVTILAR